MSNNHDNDERAEEIDRAFQVMLAKITGGISPAAVMLAFFDWYIHFIIHPSKQTELLTLIQNNLQHFTKQFIAHLNGDQTGEYSLLPLPQDKRFIGPLWQQFPYTFYYESFLMMQNWWRVAVKDVRGVSKHHEDVVDFCMRQVMDMISPSNSLLTNPELQLATRQQNGKNLLRGLENLLDDQLRQLKGEPPFGAEKYIIGKNIATTSGKIIFRNQLIELIQYKPLTKTVYENPILITPAWIMKYYILDLTPQHSLVKYLIDHGHTVFMISWKNPKKDDRHLSMNDYLELGIFAALKAITKIDRHPTHLVGYCLGGTLSAMAAATIARDKSYQIASLTLLAAQIDFTEPGELALFIDESQISFLESLMQNKGYLDTHQMAGAFQLLRSNDLIWSRYIHDYLLGDRKPLTDLMAWNADATRMPYKMHSEYLRQLFMNNELAAGKYLVDGRPIALTDIKVPLFAVATEKDHVSPWRSVFKINLLTTGDVRFVLTSGGHNVGIVSIPTTNTKRYYRVSTLKKSERFIDADTWYAKQNPIDGSWWPAFETWLAQHSGKKVAPPSLGNVKAGYPPLLDAPGEYVLEK